MRGKKRRGGALIVGIAISGVILLFGLFFLELQELYDYQYSVEVRAQRAVNSCVEFAMDDQYRADGFNVMDVQKARDNLERFLDEDLNVDSRKECRDSNGNLLYRVSYSNMEFQSGRYYPYEPRIDVDITVYMAAGLGKAFDMDGYTWTNHFSSVNFRTDGSYRNGNIE